MEQVGRAALCGAALLIACGRGDDVSRRGDIAISHLVAPAPLSSTMSVYFTVANTGSTADTLTGIGTPLAHSAMMHDQVTRGGMTRMTAVPHVVIPAHGEVRFAPGGRHLMLEGLTRPIVAGDTIALTLTFARAGDVSARSRVVTYADLDAALRR